MGHDARHPRNSAVQTGPRSGSLLPRERQGAASDHQHQFYVWDSWECVSLPYLLDPSLPFPLPSSSTFMTLFYIDINNPTISLTNDNEKKKKTEAKQTTPSPKPASSA